MIQSVERVIQALGVVFLIACSTDAPSSQPTMTIAPSLSPQSLTGMATSEAGAPPTPGVTILSTTGPGTSVGGTNPPGVPDGYIPTPSGWFHSSCVRTVPNGGHVDTSLNITLNGEFIRQDPPCPYEAILTTPGG